MLGQEHVGAVLGSGDTSRGGFAVQREGLLGEAVAMCTFPISVHVLWACYKLPPPGTHPPSEGYFEEKKKKISVSHHPGRTP